MTVFKELNNMLSIRTDFSMQDLINSMSDAPMYFEQGGILRGSFGDIITPTPAVFSLIKNIMISEDMRFTSHHHLGRYKFQIAVLDHILNNKPIDQVL